MALCLAFSFITLSSNAQVDSTTGNLINFTGTPTDTTSNWNNGVYVNTLCFQYGQAGNCGPSPSIRASSGSINFSYGTTDLNQVVNINRALAAGGSGVQLSGFNFGFTAKNGNGWDDGRQDYLGAYVKFYNAGGGLAANYDYTSQTNRKYNWTNFNFSETFSSPVAATNFSNAQVGFVGRDNNYWAGNYGPEIINVSFSLKYRVDPCATNVAYSPNCAGYNNVVYSSSVFDNNVWGQAVSQAAAVNVALQNAGIGATVHGFNYAFDWMVGDRQCTSQFLICWSYADSNLNVKVGMTDKNGSNLFSQSYDYSGANISGSTSGKYLLPSSTNQTNIGYIWASTSGWGDAQAGNFRSSLIYTPDPCAADPLYSTQCKGYAVAYAKTMLLGSTVASASYVAPQVPAAAPAVTAPDPTVSPAQQVSTSAQAAPTQSSPNPQQDANQNPAVAQDNPAQPSPTQAGPAPTSTQPAGGPPQTATASAPQQSSSPQQGGGGSGGGGPSKLAMSVVKSAQAKDQAVQASAVQQAAKAFDNAVQSATATSNAAVSMNQDMSANSATAAAQFSSQQTQASVQSSVQASQSPQQQQSSSQQQQSGRYVQQTQQTQQEVQQVQNQSSVNFVQAPAPLQKETQQVQPTVNSTQPIQTNSIIYSATVQQQDTQSTAVAMLKPTPPAPVEIQQQASSGTGLTVGRNLFAYNPLGSLNLSSMTLVPTQTAPIYQPRLQERAVDIEAPQAQVVSFGGIGKPGNPLSEIMMQQKFEMMQENIQSQTSTVNRNVLPNELAGGVDISSIASVPAGFNAYSFILKDASFYEPKEVYKNQRTVDNERVLRGLTRGSDSLHQQMVDQQYKLGN